MRSRRARQERLRAGTPRRRHSVVRAHASLPAMDRCRRDMAPPRARRPVRVHEGAGIDEGRRPQRRGTVDAVVRCHVEEERGMFLNGGAAAECLSDLHGAMDRPHIAKHSPGRRGVTSLSCFEPDLRQSAPCILQRTEAFDMPNPARRPRIVEAMERLKTPQAHRDHVHTLRGKAVRSACARGLVERKRRGERHRVRIFATDKGFDRSIVAPNDVGDPIGQAQPLEHGVRCRRPSDLLELPGEFHGGSVREGWDIQESALHERERCPARTDSRHQAMRRQAEPVPRWNAGN